LRSIVNRDVAHGRIPLVPDRPRADRLHGLATGRVVFTQI
jgi:hypothetical protein